MKRLHNKNAFLLLTGLGISNLGDFIYLVAINLLVLQKTGSPTAIAGLWMMGPIAAILTKFWAGSYIDRMNRRKLLIITDIIRALIVALIPFLHSLWLFYIALFFLAVSKAFFIPTSVTYITGMIPQEKRKQFNSFRSLLTSGSFLIGPAIAGGLLLVASLNTAIWINAASFLVSAVILSKLPDIDSKSAKGEGRTVTLAVLKKDWSYVLKFARQYPYIVMVYSLAQLFIIVSHGMDAQEVVFTQQVLYLSETDYSLLVSITGIGTVAGASLVSLIAKKISIKNLMTIGYVMVTVGYMIYAFSFSFWSVAIGFIVLGFFNSFANTGFMTFYQNNVPNEMMGRISSVFGTFQSVFQILIIFLIGFTGDVIPLRITIISASILMFVISFIQILLIQQPHQQKHFYEKTEVL